MKKNQTPFTNRSDNISQDLSPKPALAADLIQEGDNLRLALVNIGDITATEISLAPVAVPGYEDGSWTVHFDDVAVLQPREQKILNHKNRSSLRSSALQEAIGWTGARPLGSLNNETPLRVSFQDQNGRRYSQVFVREGGRFRIGPVELRGAPNRLRTIFSSIFAGEGKSRTEIWKIVLPAALALLLSAPFISALIPRYKLQIKAPAFRKDGVYEAPAGTVFIKWGMTKERWFQETDVSDVSANLIVSKSGGEVEASLQNQPGEARISLKPGRYEVRIDAVAYQRNETIALQITPSSPSAATLTGTVIEPNGKAIQGAKVTVDELPGMTPAETSTNGAFIIKEIPKPYGELVRIRVIKEGYKPNPHTEEVLLGEKPPRVALKRDR